MQHPSIDPKLYPSNRTSSTGARDCQTGKFVFSYLLACLKSGHSRVIFMNYFRNNNGQRIHHREETKKDIRKSSEETVGVAFWPDLTQY